MKNLESYFSSAIERERIRRSRDAGEPPPWTDDRAFRRWRFCNVRREDDRTTVWFREHVRDLMPARTPAERVRAVEAAMIFRWFNRIDIGEQIADLLISGWNRPEARRRLGEWVGPMTNAAYMVNTPPGFKKLDGILECVDGARGYLPAMVARWGRSLREAHTDLLMIPRVGSFVAYEIVTDLRWTPVLDKAEDIRTWAAAGPGCAWGLGYLVDDDPKHFKYGSRKDQAEMLDIMRALVTLSRYPRWWPYEDAPWEMREAEMWACEYAKWRKAMAGRRLKRTFKLGEGGA